MMEKFNFYDVFGYLIPGSIFLLLVWLPFGLAGCDMSLEGWRSGLAVVSVSYVFGQMLQSLMMRLFPPRERDKAGNSRYTSDIVLDDDDSRLSPEFKASLAKRIKENTYIGIDIKTDRSAREVEEDLSNRRRDAFFLCRSMLTHAKSSSFCEKLEAMWGLMCGLTPAFALAFFNFLGWAALGDCKWFLFRSGAVVIWALLAAVLVSFLISVERFFPRQRNAVKSNEQRRLARRRWLTIHQFLQYFRGIGLMAAFLFAPPALGPMLTCTKGFNKPILMYLLTLVLALVTLMCLDGYRYFGAEFTKAVYHDFLVLNRGRLPEE
jgi:hypothetical protein